MLISHAAASSEQVFFRQAESSLGSHSVAVAESSWQVLTPATFYRTHPVESLLYWLRGIVATAAVAGPFFWMFRGQEQMWQVLGVHAAGFGFNFLGGNLRHSQQERAGS